MFNLRSLALLTTLSFLFACSSPVSVTNRPEPAFAELKASHPEDLTGMQLYRLLPHQSTLHILVYRAGPLAELGHNHVVSSDSLEGFVWTNDDHSRSGFDLVQPVNSLIVDDPASRLAEGDQFPLNLDEEARAATRRNMLLPAGLDGDQYPYIRLYSTGITGALPQPVIQVAIIIKGQTQELHVPVQISQQENVLLVEGEFTIQQTDFGMTPMSVMAGALRVENEVTIKFGLMTELQAP